MKAQQEGDICMNIADLLHCTAETNKHYKEIILQLKKNKARIIKENSGKTSDCASLGDRFHPGK